ncbi:nucleotide disphospho-sugar-binding domain-containing protein [Kutzneria sp. NPDC051319]|uniref:nucleotide disphospho-sugar-binding domain-containing protein n=1 Tax=Kutzneria sp. NPDC051319 TaxID=3155047 RepID=UPI003445A18E
MKVLVTACPTYGHFFPLVPLCWALRNGGHDVLVALPGRFADVAAAAGLPAVRLGPDCPVRDFVPDDHAVQDNSTAALIDHVVAYYLPLAERLADRTVELAAEWRPDVVLHTPWEHAGPLAAAVVGIPTVIQTWGVALPPELPGATAAALADLHRRWGLAGVAEPTWTVEVCPPGLQYPDAHSAVLPMTYVPYNGSGPMPRWLLERSDRPRICVTLGSIPIPGDHASVLDVVLAGLAEVAADVVLVTGGNLAPLDDLPPHVRAVTGLPLSHALPTCDVIVHHGGSGTTMTSTAFGLPQLALPQMCDQYRHAERLSAAGAGIQLLPGQVDAVTVRASVSALLEDGSHRAAAQALRTEIRHRPSPDLVADSLHDLVRLAEVRS